MAAVELGREGLAFVDLLEGTVGLRVGVGYPQIKLLSILLVQELQAP